MAESANYVVEQFVARSVLPSAAAEGAEQLSNGSTVPVHCHAMLSAFGVVAKCERKKQLLPGDEHDLDGVAKRDRRIFKGEPRNTPRRVPLLVIRIQCY